MCYQLQFTVFSHFILPRPPFGAIFVQPLNYVNISTATYPRGKTIVSLDLQLCSKAIQL